MLDYRKILLSSSASLLAVLALCSLLLPSCTQGNLDMLGMFYTKSEGADERFTQSEEWNATHPFDVVRAASDNYRIYVMTDIHVDTTTLNLDTFTNAFLAEASIQHIAMPSPEQTTTAPFCFCLGDIINAVNNYPKFMAYVDKINAAGFPVYGTPGNHDIYYDQWQVYQSYWHTSHYCLTVQTPSGFSDFYIFLDSSDGTLGRLQTDWLRNVLKENQGKHRHTMVCTHTHLWKKDQSQGHTSNFALEETYELADLFARYGVGTVIQGHSHCRDVQDFKGVKYVRLDALEDHYYNAFYTILTMGEHVSWDFIPVGPQNNQPGYVRVEGM